MGYSSELLISDINWSQLCVSFFNNGLVCSPVLGSVYFQGDVPYMTKLPRLPMNYIACYPA